MKKEIPKTEDDWKHRLTPKQYKILREKSTELPFTSELLHNKEEGVYACAACGHVLFSSEAKFDSGTGWPSFDTPENIKNVMLKEDNNHDMHRTEVLCKHCKSHLGHVFPDGPTSTRQRYCINGCALEFKKKNVQ